MSEISNNREESRENDRGKEKEPLLRRAMDAFGTIFALNVCFVVGCIPIFTVGASLSALYAMCIRLQEDEEETVVAGFIHEFKRNFKQSTIAYFFILLAIFVLGYIGDWLNIPYLDIIGYLSNLVGSAIIKLWSFIL